MFSCKLSNKITQVSKKFKPIFLGKVKFRSPLLLAPLAGITNAPFRYLFYHLGIGGAVTELLSAHALSFKSKRTLKMIYLHPIEESTGVQIFAEDPLLLNSMAKSIAQFHPPFIDINMGCPVRKVIKRGAGSRLLLLDDLPSFIARVAQDLPLPLTIKVRSGFDRSNIGEVIEQLSPQHLSFITLHGRTATQMYQGMADWDYIEKVARQSTIPIVGNGDLTDPLLIRQKLQNSACAALMIGRGALKNPFIFIQSLIDEEFDNHDYLEVINVLNKLLVQEKDNFRLALVKQMASAMVASKADARLFRQTLFMQKDEEKSLQLIKEYFLSHTF